MRFEANQLLSRVTAGEGPLSPDSLCSHRVYEQHRSGLIEVVGRWKKDRRVLLGEAFTLLFENRLTVWLQIQEELHMGGARRSDEVERLLSQYNPLIPDAGELRASLFLDCADREKLLGYLSEYPLASLGMELHLDGTVFEAQPLEVSEQYLDAVTYVKFRPTEEVVLSSVSRLRTGGLSGASTDLRDRTKRSLLRDLQRGCASASKERIRPLSRMAGLV